MTRLPRTLAIRLTCHDLPEFPGLENSVQIGLQDKDQDVHEGSLRQDGCLEWRCTVEVRGDAGSGLPAFFGPFVHGPPSGRFLYLSWMRTAPTPTIWLRRVKVPLAALTWEQVDAGLVEADIPGRRTGTVPVCWRASRAEPAPD